MCVTNYCVCVCVDAEIPHDEGNPETPDYQFVKWMTCNKVLLLFTVLKLIKNWKRKLSDDMSNITLLIPI